MGKRSYLLNAMLIGSAIVLTGFVAAQQPAPSATQGSRHEHQGRMMSMDDDMMKHCGEHCQQTITSVEGLNKTIEEAKRSNDPNRMRAALEEVQRPLTEMKNHMSMCMGMMNMMEHMHGGMQGMGGMMEHGHSD